MYMDIGGVFMKTPMIQYDEPQQIKRSLDADTDRRAMSGPAIRTFINIAQQWNLTVDEQMVLLGRPSRSTFFKWKSDSDHALLSRDTLERVSYVLGIYKALHILYPDRAVADGWIKRDNDVPMFVGQSPMKRLLAGNVSDMYVIRQYLDAIRGWA